MTTTSSFYWWPEEASAPPVYEPDMQRSEISLEQELAGLRVLKAISQSASGIQPLDKPNSDTGRGFDVSALQTALSLAQDPATILHLSDPSIISGCIKLLRTIKNQRGTIFPYNNELGWLCFRLLVIVLDICLLERYDKLEETMVLPNQRPDIRAAPHILASAHLACGVYAQLDAINAGDDCDWVFGWSISSDQPRQKLLLPPSEALNLMNIIWEDRKLFLRVLYSCATTSRPVLCGLLFLFSRGLAHMRELRPLANMTILGSRFYELAVRYLLVTDKYQQIIQLMCDHETQSFIGIGPRVPRHVDSEDSRAILTAFIRRLTAGDDPDILRRREPCTTLRLVPVAIDTEAQNLIPEVVRCIIEYGWSVLPTIEGQLGQAGGAISLIYEALRQAYRLEPRIQTQIIDIIHDHDLPDLTARVIIQLDLRDLTIAENILREIFEFHEEFRGILDARSDLEKRFLHYVPEWWKSYRYMQFARYALSSELPADHQEPYIKHIKMWGMVAKHLGIGGQRPGICGHLSKHEVVECSNPRCALAYTSMTEGARFACAECKLAFYCDDRCQSIDSSNHRVVCNARRGLIYTARPSSIFWIGQFEKPAPVGNST
ncbi:unnamed protein product [Rhizoctonia solani]|uniref:MYND-type domain-containing protein n=1 Tax=Rhizoctonia solani TaxID=456999 RepID=A0A8H3E324_9AGAM|nr:unnamed protein product [Rhizoctonia solani]